MLGGSCCCALVFRLNSLGVVLLTTHGKVTFFLSESIRRAASVDPFRCFLVQECMSLFLYENALAFV